MPTVLINGKMFDGTGNAVINNAVIVLGDNGKIVEAGNKESVKLPAESDLIIRDLKGRFILPGLIDAHIHMDLHGMANTYEENLVEDNLRSIRAALEMEKTLKAGFTTVRNVGSVNGIDFSVKKAVEDGLVKGPRILTSGKILSITCSGTEYFNNLYRVCDGYDEFKKAAREQLKKGADLLKVMATGAIMNPGGVPGAEQPDVRELEAVVEEAGKLGKKVAAHAHGTQGIKNSVQAGVATIEHGTYADEEAVTMMADKNVYLVPTLAVGHLMRKYGREAGVPRFMLAKAEEGHLFRLNAVKNSISCGVKIAMGTDAGTPYNYHGNNAYEMVVYVQEGLMTPEEAIMSSTKFAAEACGLGEDIGTIEKGKLADLIVVDGDPLENIEILCDANRIITVFKEGLPVKDLETD
jgi:imidazolonepropionase-like amidohydrolase